jgi:hypothetical protein
VVRFFLILAFGLAFGIEGMTLIRSYFLTGGDDAEQTVEAQGPEPEGDLLRVGDDLLPVTDVTERVAQMQMRAQSSGPWIFRLVVAVANDGAAPYRLDLRSLETDDGATLQETPTVTCAPGDSTRLVATWPMGANVRPRALTAEGTVLGDGGTADSITTRRVRFGHVPVRMQR